MMAPPRLITFLLIILLPVAVLKVTGSAHSEPLGLLTSVVILWLSEFLPLAVTGLLIPCLAVCFGIFPGNVAFAAFGTSTLSLLVGSFLVVHALQRQGLDRVLASLVMRTRLASRSSEGVFVSFTMLSWFLGMWMSNTATCVLLLPVALGVADLIDPGKSGGRATTRLLLTCAFIPSIGGMSTPVGSLPNMIAVEALATSGMHVGFGQWMMSAIPVSAVLAFGAYLVLRMRFAPRGQVWEPPSLPPHESLTPSQRRVCIIFGLMVVLWLLPELVGMVLGAHEAARFIEARFPIGVVAYLAATLLFVWGVSDRERGYTPLLEQDDIRRIDWGAVLLFGGGLTIGKMLSESGLSAQLASLLFGHEEMSLSLLYSLSAVAAVLSEFSSNTATASVLVPLVADLAHRMSDQSAFTLITAAVFASGLGFMLPVSTPPNALVFGTGKVRLRDMVSAGIVLDFLGVVVIGTVLSILHTFLPSLAL